MEKRITIRLTAEEHKEFKLLALRKNTTMNALLKKYVTKEILEEKKREKN